MSRSTLPKTLATLWPDYEWTPINAGFERCYRCRKDEYEIVVEWRGGNSTMTITRFYGEGTQVSVLGASVGTTAEGLRRAFAEARLAWMRLQTFPPSPLPATLEELLADHNYLRRLVRGGEDTPE
jgi:hypothetical protein